MKNRLPILIIALVGILVGGCRTYGGYGTEEEIHGQLSEAVRVFAADLARARTEYAVLADGARRLPVLVPFSTRYGALLQAHEVVLDEHRALVAALEGEDDYRQLSRALGAVVVEQQTTRRHYLQLLERAMEEASAPRPVAKTYQPQSRYMLVPPYYWRQRYDRAGLSAEAVVEQAAAAGAVAPQS